MENVENDNAFYCDFTTASELEIFIARLEEIILDWGLHHKPQEKPLQKDDFKNKQWCTASEILTFSEAEFILTRYYLKCDESEEEQDEAECPENSEELPAQAIQDMLSMENDFFPVTFPPSKESHPIARWYGLRDFLVLIPQHSSYVSSESRVKILLSSLSIAINDTKCAVPFFLTALEPWQNYFLGVFQYGSFRTEFNMIHLKKTPLHCKFLTGLLNMFKSKIGIQTVLNPVTVSVRFTYLLKDWMNSSWTQEPPDVDFLGGDVLGISELGCLPFGSAYDSIKELYLHALWPSLLENSVVDSENYSDLDPLHAPIWKASITTVDNPACLLTDYYSEFVILARAKHSLRDLLGNLMSNNTNPKSGDLSSSLNVLTDSKITAFSKAVIGGEKIGRLDLTRQSQQVEGPIPMEHLMTLLYYLFPDADSNSKTPYSETLGGTLSADADSDKKSEDIEKKLSGMKSAPFDGLLWRLSHVMAHVVHSLGGVKSAAYLWYEFIQELRFRWENSVLIPGLVASFPDTRTCLLNQKLQLLNCCISKRIEREKRASEKVEEEDNEDSEEEFYDCFAEVDTEEDETGRRRSRHSCSERPEGRLSRHGDIKLLETGQPLYIPVTQDYVPKTEDQVEEDAEELLKLGSEHRAKLMSASLLSDMESFKAANPGCILADFIRWYSPRDWIEDEEGEVDEYGQRKDLETQTIRMVGIKTVIFLAGHLSNRMEIPGNTWLEVWRIAQPVPAKRQKRLFDDTRESEKVLDFLEKKTPKEFVELLLPVLIVCVIQKLLEESATDDLPGVKEILSKLIKKAEILGRMPKIEGSRYEDGGPEDPRIFRAPTSLQDRKYLERKGNRKRLRFFIFQELLNEISAVETILVHVKSLKNKFMTPVIGEGEEKRAEKQENVMEFIKSLLSGAETEIPGGPKSEIGFAIRNIFLDASAKAEFLVQDCNTPLPKDRLNVMSPFSSPHTKEMILRLPTPMGPQRLHAVLKKNECRICGAFTKNIYLP